MGPPRRPAAPPAALSDALISAEAALSDIAEGEKNQRSPEHI
jgi:hypothetical protein